MSKIVSLDLNYVGFQNELFNLEKIEQTSFLKTCKKLCKLTWDEIYQDKGLHWEEISTKKSLSGDKILRVS